MKFRAISILLIVGVSISFSSGTAADRSGNQESPQSPERFAAIDWLIGEWQGYGQFGGGTPNYIHKRYSYEMGGMYILGRTLSMFPPEEVSTDYEIHQDLVIFYRLSESDEYRARAFYVESYVTSEKVTVSEDGTQIVMETEQIENAPAGLRTRMTWTRLPEDRMELHFEIAMPGGEYSTAERIQLKRIS